MHFFRDQNILLSTKMEIVFSNSRPGIQWWHSLKVKQYWCCNFRNYKENKMILWFVFVTAYIKKENLMVKVWIPMIGIKNIENHSVTIYWLTIMKNIPNDKSNEQFTGFICWADTISKPKNRIFMLFHIRAQNDKFGEYLIHNNATFSFCF